jgi:hypothetical protein
MPASVNPTWNLFTRYPLQLGGQSSLTLLIFYHFSFLFQTLKHIIVSSYRRLSEVKFVLDHIYDQDSECEHGLRFAAPRDAAASASNVLAYLQLMRDELFHNDPTPLHDFRHNVTVRCSNHVGDNVSGMRYATFMYEGVRGVFNNVIRVLKTTEEDEELREDEENYV